MLYSPARFFTLAQSNAVDEVILLVNSVRVAYGLPAYQVDYALMAAAQAQASWSAANNHIGHDGPGGSSPVERAIAAGYGAGKKCYATENAAHGTISLNTPQWVVQMWQGDEVHLNALISPKYQHIGVGYAEANGNSWYVLMVGYISDEASSASSSAGTPVYTIPQAPFVLSTADANGAIHHTVQAGQSLWTIAARYGIPLSQLLALNNLSENALLIPGDVLLVRASGTPTGADGEPAGAAATLVGISINTGIGSTGGTQMPGSAPALRAAPALDATQLARSASLQQTHSAAQLDAQSSVQEAAQDAAQPAQPARQKPDAKFRMPSLPLVPALALAGIIIGISLLIVGARMKR